MDYTTATPEFFDEYFEIEKTPPIEIFTEFLELMSIEPEGMAFEYGTQADWEGPTAETITKLRKQNTKQLAKLKSEIKDLKSEIEQKNVEIEENGEMAKQEVAHQVEIIKQLEISQNVANIKNTEYETVFSEVIEISSNKPKYTYLEFYSAPVLAIPPSASMSVESGVHKSSTYSIGTLEIVELDHNVKPSCSFSCSKSDIISLGTDIKTSSISSQTIENQVKISEKSVKKTPSDNSRLETSLYTVNLDSHQLETNETTETSTETSSTHISKITKSELHHINISSQSNNRTTSTDQGITCDIVGLDWIELIEEYDGKLEKLLEKLDNLQEMVTLLDQDNSDSSDKLNESSSRLEESEKERRDLEKQVEEACNKFLEMEGKCIEIEMIYEMSRKELEAVQDVYNGCRDENSRMKQKCSELKKRVKQGKKQRKWQVERLRKIQLDMKRLNFMPKIGGSFGGEMSESNSSEHKTDTSTGVLLKKQNHEIFFETHVIFISIALLSRSTSQSWIGTTSCPFYNL